MSSPLQFYRSFKALLAEHGIRAVLTSGMACVEYGIQQTTKDTDWIIHPDDINSLSNLFCSLERGLSGTNWRISYRTFFGAPLVPTYLASGWTTHLAIHDEPNSPEHHVDLFGKPPRLTFETAHASARDGIAAPLVVAQMKKTDRDKDWPMVEALSQQAALAHDPDTLLHTSDPELLTKLWTDASAQTRSRLAKRRPLLLQIQKSGTSIPRCLALERALWEEINKLRYRSYQLQWKEFLRRWRSHDDFAWPVSAPFEKQHHLVCQAAQDFCMPMDPLGGINERTALIQKASATVAEIFNASADLLESLQPPLEELLP